MSRRLVVRALWAGVFSTIILCSCAVAVAQVKPLWQGYVVPRQINVYMSNSTNSGVNTILNKGDSVDVNFQVKVLMDDWCRISRSGTAEPLGFVLCFNLRRGQAAQAQSIHAASAATESRAAAPVLAEATSGSTALTNKDVLDLHKAGLSGQVIIAKIKSSKCNFDTSPSQLSQLKSAGLADDVILAIVEAPQGYSDPAAEPNNVVPKEANPQAQEAQAVDENSRSISGSPCVILKRMGPADQITSHLYAYGLRGKQFQFVEGRLPQGVTFHGRLTDHDVRIIQDKGGQVQILESKYNVPDLEEARKGCH